MLIPIVGHMCQTLILIHRDLYCTIVSDWVHDEDGLDKEEFTRIKRSDLRKIIPLLRISIFDHMLCLNTRKCNRVKKERVNNGLKGVYHPFFLKDQSACVV